MRIISIIALIIFFIPGFVMAGAVGDQELYGTANVKTIPVQTGDRSLIETGGMPMPESNSALIENCDVTSNMRIPGIVQKERHGTSSNADWGLDIMVMGDTLATDPFLLRTADSVLYVVYKYMGPAITANSSVTIATSTNGGDTWSWVLDASVDDTTEIYNLDVVLDDEGDSTFIFAICNAQNDDIWLLRYNITANTTDWVEVTFGSVYDPAIDQMGSTTSKYCYMTYLVNDNTLRFRASSDYGATWTSSYDVHTTGPIHNPDIRMNVGDNIWAYIVWDNGPVAYSKANNYQGFDGWAAIATHTHNFRGGSDDVNGQITGVYDTDTMFVVAEENLNNTGDWNLVWDYTLDGLAWRDDTLFPDVDLANDPARDEQFFRLLESRSTGGLDQTRVAWNSQTNASDTRVDYRYFQNGNWTTTTTLSDYLAKEGTAPSTNYVPEGGGGAIAYCGYSAVWYDNYWNTAIQESPVTEPYARYLQLAPNISQDFARLTFTTRNSGHVNISVFDAAGRLVETVLDESIAAGEHSANIDGRNLAAGIYFVKVETPDGVGTKTMTIVR
jgi:hypothetical protein